MLYNNIITIFYLLSAYLTCVIRALYNLTYYQVVAGVLLGLSRQQRALPLPGGALARSAQLLLSCLPCPLLDDDDAPEPSSSGQDAQLAPVDWDAMELQVQQQLLPYLRIAALLRHHLCGEELPKIAMEELEFESLFRYLEFIKPGKSSISIF